MKIKITGVGSYIPEIKVANTDFEKHFFLNEDGSSFFYPNEVVINKFKSITGIEQRRYAAPDQCSSDLAFLASQKAIENSGIDPETIDSLDPVGEITRRYTAALERLIRRAPEQYFWIHRRWKSQPKQRRISCSSRKAA